MIWLAYQTYRLFGKLKTLETKLSNKIKACNLFHHHFHFHCSAFYLFLGHVHLAQNQAKEAQEYYDKAIFQDHENAYAKNHDPKSLPYLTKLVLCLDYNNLVSKKYSKLEDAGRADRAYGDGNYKYARELYSQLLEA